MTIDAETANLVVGKTYAVRIAAGAIKDYGGVAYPGIANETTWTFDTGAPWFMAVDFDDDDAGSPTQSGFTSFPVGTGAVAKTLDIGGHDVTLLASGSFNYLDPGPVGDPANALSDLARDFGSAMAACRFGSARRHRCRPASTASRDTITIPHQASWVRVRTL